MLTNLSCKLALVGYRRESGISPVINFINLNNKMNLNNIVIVNATDYFLSIAFMRGQRSVSWQSAYQLSQQGCVVARKYVSALIHLQPFLSS